MAFRGEMLSIDTVGQHGGRRGVFGEKVMRRGGNKEREKGENRKLTHKEFC